MPMYMPERILVAPSGFKESLSAVDVADAIAAGVRRVYPGVRIDRQPIPDGGEGTIEILSTRPDAIPHHKKVQGPVEGQSVAATWLELANKTAVVEMASAAGLSLVPSDMRDPGMTSTVGVGELIADALDKGMRTIIIGCGDSGTTDGGAGALIALGVRILDENGADIGLGGNSLHNAASIDTTNLHPRIHQARLHLACNMHNVLTPPPAPMAQQPCSGRKKAPPRNRWTAWVAPSHTGPTCWFRPSIPTPISTPAPVPGHPGAWVPDSWLLARRLTTVSTCS